VAVRQMIRLGVVMAEVACYCGCSYSFYGDAGACPHCGEVATLRTRPVTSGTVPAGAVPASAVPAGTVWDHETPNRDEATDIAPRASLTPAV
jgi:hypothetical protein